MTHRPLFLLAFAIGTAGAAAAESLRADLVGGSVQLGGDLIVRVSGASGELPQGATCDVSLPRPYDGHLAVVSHDCANLTLKQATVPVRDDNGHALPGGQVPYTITATGSDGAEIGTTSGVFPYNNGFSDIRIEIVDVRNPVSPGESFEAVVYGAEQPIDESLTCRWNTYGPVTFDATSDNGCEGRLTATEPDGRDADMDVGIFNLTDMHAVGYATAKMLVE